MRNVGIHYPERNRIDFVDLGPPPEPGLGQILIETRYSGITNGTERHALIGEHAWSHAPYPARHGYQNVGVIKAVGPGVVGFAEGQWVFCGQYVGHLGWHLVDVSSHGVHPDPPHLVYPLPALDDYGPCALMGVAGVAMRHIRRCRVAPARKVWIAGQGPIGGFCAQAAKAIGALVTVTDVNPRRLEVARQCGPDRVLDAREPGVFDALREWAPYDVIVEACGLDSFYFDVFRHGLLGHHGVIGSVAVRSETTFPWSMLHGTEASIEVSCHFRLDDLHVLMTFVNQGRIQLEPVISHRVSIDDALGVYATLRDDPSALLGVVFEWG